MVAVFINGKRVGTFQPDDQFSELLRNRPVVEFRDDNDQTLGSVLVAPPEPPTPAEPLVPWDPTITVEELERRKNGPSYSYEEMCERLGWK